MQAAYNANSDYDLSGDTIFIWLNVFFELNLSKIETVQIPYFQNTNQLR